MKQNKKSVNGWELQNRLPTGYVEIFTTVKFQKKKIRIVENFERTEICG